jgi:phosphatidylserine/phosphatidylglycerophosphate/cardiolipin synthase-like enzyme
MTRDAHELIEPGRALKVPPRLADERRAFSGWLASAMALCGLEPAFLAKELGIPVRDIDSMLCDQSHGTAKADRSRVHAFVLDRIARSSRAPSRTRLAGPRAKVREVLAGRVEEAAFFSPGDDLRSVVTTVIASAKSEIRIQTWQITCPVILDALLTSPARIEVAVSQENRTCSALRKLMRAPRIDVYCDPKRKNHNKTIVVDRRILLTGSLNFLYGSGRHDENVVVTSRRSLVEAYWKDLEAKRARLSRVRPN